MQLSLHHQRSWMKTDSVLIYKIQVNKDLTEFDKQILISLLEDPEIDFSKICLPRLKEGLSQHGTKFLKEIIVSKAISTNDGNYYRSHI